jgi:dTDP-4-amino-4,6-dideoxygalactose transaminase
VDSRSVTSVARPKSIVGAVRDLSRTLGKSYGAAHAILVDHGSTAIRAALRALDVAGRIPRGTVAMPCNVWRGVYASAAFAGCRSVELLDVHPGSGVLTPELLENCVDLDVVVAVDGYGVKPAIAQIRKQSSLSVIEDASLSQVPSRNPLGGLAADICIMSLQSNKLLSCGEGGLMLTDRDDLGSLIEAIVCDGRPWLEGLSDEPLTMGFNGMMSEDIAELLARNLADHAEYLRTVAQGASKVVCAMEGNDIPAWLDAELARSGRLFALPVSSAARERLSSFGTALSSPPSPPTAGLRKLLCHLPARFALREAYPNASQFADITGLVPHWDLHALGVER